MMEDKNHISGPLAFSAVLIIISLGLYFAGPAITGFVVREFQYSDDVNLVVAASFNYTWNIENPGDLKSLKLSGKMSKYGNAKVYLEGKEGLYLIFDSERLNETSNITANFSGPPENLITGFASFEAESQLNETNETGSTESPPNITNDEFGVIINETQINDSIGDLPQDFDSLNSSNETIGINQSNELINLSEENETGTITNNTPPYWNSETDYFTLNKSLEIDLNEYFKDDENDELFFSVSDAEDIEESLANGILKVSSSKSEFNATIEINASDNFSVISREIFIIAAENPENISQNISKNISVKLFYSGDSNFDMDNDGKELITGVIDVGVSSGLNWDADKSRLCTRWKILNEGEGIETNFCNGNIDCCAFAGLVPRNEKWDEVYYSNFGKDSAGFENSVSAQAIYYDVNLSLENPKSDVYFSDFESLPLEFEDDDIKFSDVCIESCRLNEENESSYRLIFEIEGGALLRIDNIDYNVLIDIGNAPPELIKNISTIRIGTNSFASIDLSDYFADPDNDELKYSYYSSDNLKMLFNNSIATIVPEADFEGVVYAFITANDSKRTRTSNVFLINVSSDFLESEEQIEIGKPVRWLKKIRIDSEDGSINITIPKSSVNISVALFDGNAKRDLDESSIAVFDDGIKKTRKEFEAEQELKKVEKQISFMESSLSSKIKVLDTDGKVLDNYEINNRLNKLYTQRSIIRSGGRLFRKLSLSNAGFVNVSVNESLSSGDELIYSYETEAPVSIESRINDFTKQVKIVSETSYQNVKAYTSLNDVGKNAITLYWLQNGEKVPFNDISYLDENNNGLIDKIEWVVPHLSNQTFEVSITILNVQSYPTIFGNWTVLFNTTGTGNLTISASNGTTYSELGVDSLLTLSDLVPLELRCDDNLFFSSDSNYEDQRFWLLLENGSYSKFGDISNLSVPVKSAYVSDYNCSGTGRWTVQVITIAKHHQMFNFSGQVAYAHNDVTAINLTIALNGSTFRISSNIAVSGNVNLSNGTNFSYKAIDLRLNGVLISFNVTNKRNRNFTDDINSDFNSGVHNGTIADNGNLSINTSLFMGNGSDGNISISSANSIVNNYTFLVNNSALSGASIIAINDSKGFPNGSEILIIAMNGTYAGNYEFRVIDSIIKNNITLNTPLSYNYEQNANRTQIVRVPNFVNVTVNSGASITAPAYNNRTGGIVVFRATGVLTINGNISTDGTGFMGGGGGSGGSGGIAGLDGGAGSAGGMGLGAGGGGGGKSKGNPGTWVTSCGGGGAGTYTGGGAGGSHRTAASNGNDGTQGSGGGGGDSSNPGTQCTNGGGFDGNSGSAAGTAGSTYGASNLSTVFLGSGGGGGAGGSGGGGGTGGLATGGAGGSGGVGGVGGGIIYVEASNIINNGKISTNGSSGSSGTSGSDGLVGGSGFESGGGGAPGSGGGGGGGGTIYIKSNYLTVGTLAVGGGRGASGGNGGNGGGDGSSNTAGGGGGAGASPGSGGPGSISNGANGGTAATGSGSSGGVGRIKIITKSVSGTIPLATALSGTLYGNFTSQLFDAGATVNWTMIEFYNETPPRTNFSLWVRTSDDGLTLSGFSNISRVSPVPLGNVSRFIQYRIELYGNDSLNLPVIRNVSINATGLFTNEIGNYNFTFAAPPAAGTYTLKVNSSFNITMSGMALTTFTTTTTNSPTVDFTNGTFIIQNKTGGMLAVWDAYGNLNIKGTLTTGSVTFDTNDFVMYEFEGTPTTARAVVTNPEGNLMIQGALNQNQGTLSPSSVNSFIVQNKTGRTVSYIDTNGDLYLIRTLVENVLFT